MTNSHNAENRGFVIASEHEEFLLVFEKNVFGIFKGWGLTPENAIIYETRLKASRVLKKLDVSYRVWILEFWETDKQFFVSSSSEDKPDWLK